MCLLHASAPYFILRPHCRHHRHRVTLKGSPTLLYLSYLCTPSLPPTSDLKPRGPSTTFRPRLLSVGVVASILLLFGRVERPVKPTLLLRTTVYLSFFFLLVFVSLPSNSFWPGLPSDRQHKLSTAAFSDRPHPFPCHTYTHADLYVLTNLPGRDLSQPLCAGCVAKGLVQRPYVQLHYMIHLFCCNAQSPDRDLLLLAAFLLSFVRVHVCACACPRV